MKTTRLPDHPDNDNETMRFLDLEGAATMYQAPLLRCLTCHGIGRMGDLACPTCDGRGAEVPHQTKLAVSVLKAIEQDMVQRAAIAAMKEAAATGTLDDLMAGGQVEIDGNPHLRKHLRCHLSALILAVRWLLARHVQDEDHGQAIMAYQRELAGLWTHDGTDEPHREG